MELRDELKAVLGDKTDEELLKIALGTPVVITVLATSAGEMQILCDPKLPLGLGFSVLVAAAKALAGMAAEHPPEPQGEKASD